MIARTEEKFSTSTTTMKKFSRRASIILTERVFLYPADQNTKENGVKWGFRQRRKKFSSKQHKWCECREQQTKTYMRWQRKKGQKWPKNGGPKRVKNGQKRGSKKGPKKGQKSTFSSSEKSDWRKKEKGYQRGKGKINSLNKIIRKDKDTKKKKQHTVYKNDQKRYTKKRSKKTPIKKIETKKKRKKNS
jgi:hypothetical protein